MSTKLNDVALKGNVASIKTNPGQNGGIYGSITLGVNDGHYKTVEQSINASGKQWQDRSYFIRLNVTEKTFKDLFCIPEIGDELIVKGKLVTKEMKPGEHPVLLVEVTSFIDHTPKTLKELGRQQGLVKPRSNQHQSNQSGVSNGFSQ